jgi:hypothetical protein
MQSYEKVFAPDWRHLIFLVCARMNSWECGAYVHVLARLPLAGEGSLREGGRIRCARRQRSAGIEDNGVQLRGNGGRIEALTLRIDHTRPTVCPG